MSSAVPPWSHTTETIHRYLFILCSSVQGFNHTSNNTCPVPGFHGYWIEITKIYMFNYWNGREEHIFTQIVAQHFLSQYAFKMSKLFLPKAYIAIMWKWHLKCHSFVFLLKCAFFMGPSGSSVDLSECILQDKSYSSTLLMFTGSSAVSINTACSLSTAEYSMLSFYRLLFSRM